MIGKVGRGKRRLASLAAMLAIVVAAPSGAAATIYNPPWADLICSHYPGTGGLDTRQSCANGVPLLNFDGYKGFNDVNVTGSSALGTAYAQSDAVWAIFGHGGPGGISTYPGSGTAWTYVFSSSSHGSCSAPNACINLLPTQLRRVRLMIFGGCETAETNELQSAASTAGVDSSIAFKRLIYWPHMDGWSQSFFFWTDSDYGNSIQTAVVLAENDVYARYGGYGGTDSVNVVGGSVRLIPAAYGS